MILCSNELTEQPKSAILFLTKSNLCSRPPVDVFRLPDKRFSTNQSEGAMT